MAKIGIFDSGYGGLTILSKIRSLLPQYDYVYLGDNARTPYGTRSFEVVYQYTLQCVKTLFDKDCDLVILACNTASAKALRTIQQLDLPQISSTKRVLGVIRPTVEVVNSFTKNGKVGLLATSGTVQSDSYAIEIAKLFPEIELTSLACPMWVPLIENREHDAAGADYFVSKNINQLLEQCPDMDTLILGCTHYPLLLPKIKQYLPEQVQVISQGDVVARSLKDYLNRHSEMEQGLDKNNSCTYFTTESVEKFNSLANVFLESEVDAQQIVINS